MRAVRFGKDCGVREAGDVVSYDDASAQWFVDAGYAAYVDDDGTAGAAPSARTPVRADTGVPVSADPLDALAEGDAADVAEPE